MVKTGVAISLTFPQYDAALAQTPSFVAAESVASMTLELPPLA